jgi:hypothetical protein
MASAEAAKWRRYKGRTRVGFQARVNCLNGFTARNIQSQTNTFMRLLVVALIAVAEASAHGAELLNSDLENLSAGS